MQIPTHPMYDISEYGVVTLISTGEEIPEYRNHKGRRAVKIRGKSHKPASQPLDRLMLKTYKPLPEDQDSEWWSVRFVNDERDDLDISNLEWDPTQWIPNPLIGVELGRTVWIDAYGYPQIQIRLFNDNVYVRNTVTWEEIGFKVDAHGYAQIRIPGVSKEQRLHRIVALTFLTHPMDTDHLTVNHKDSNKLNNDPKNLEWTTYTENNKHAYDQGPRSTTVRKITLLNVESGTESVVSGFNEMARVMGILPQAAHQAMTRRKFEGRPYKGFLFKFSDDRRSWDELKNSPRRSDSFLPPKIARRDMLTGEVVVYESHRELFFCEGIRDFMLLRLLRSPTMIPWRYRCFQEFTSEENLKWPDIPKEILDVYAEVHSSDRPVQVSDKTGTVRYYANLTKWCMEDRSNRCDPAVISRYMKKSGKEPLVWRGFKFEYVDLTKFKIN